MGDAARADDLGASPAALIDRALLRLAKVGTDRQFPQEAETLAM